MRQDEPYVEPYMEPWMRGHRMDMNPVLAGVLYSFEHAWEDIQKWTAPLTDEQLWEAPGQCGSVGFHIRHIAGSVERLLTYAQGGQLSEAQLAALKREREGGISKAELIGELQASLQAAEDVVREIDPRQLEDTRYIGRKRIATTLGVLLIHIAEHTQRHVGEAIVTSKIVRGLAR